MRPLWRRRSSSITISQANWNVWAWNWVSMAPRYSDGFEKGLEFVGDKPKLIENFAGHHAVAQLHGGYKISMHTGSDKFSVYPQLVEATAGRIHLKTSGTSWLTALTVIARASPPFCVKSTDSAWRATSRRGRVTRYRRTPDGLRSWMPSATATWKRSSPCPILDRFCTWATEPCSHRPTTKDIAGWMPTSAKCSSRTVTSTH